MMHTVKITGTEDNPAIEFTCSGDRDSDCHEYPNCRCETWGDDHEKEFGHPVAKHEKCWMQDWFDNDGISPSTDVLDDCGYTVGMSGSIRTLFDPDFIEWEFNQ